MFNMLVAVKTLENGEFVPVGYKQSSGHIILDIKIVITQEVRWVKYEHKTPEPDTSNYTGVVSRESIRIALSYATLNDVNLPAADIQNA